MTLAKRSSNWPRVNSRPILRITRGFERFQTVILDFSGVEEIGQAFADEVFRVFQTAHPDIAMTPIHTSDAVNAMISRAKAHS